MTDLTGQRILITGGTGAMGAGLRHRLTERGAQIRLLVLPGDPNLAALKKDGVEFILGDVTQPSTLAHAVEGADTVIHMAAVILSPNHPEIFDQVNHLGTQTLLNACSQQGLPHFIFISSASVIYPKSNPYSRSKIRAETAVKKYAGNFTIIRPTLAYNQTGGEEFHKFCRYLIKAPVVFLPGTGRTRKSPVHIEDIIGGLSRIPGNPRAFGKTYNFCGPDSLPLREMTHTLLAHFGLSKPVIFFPAFLWQGAVWVIQVLCVLTGFKSNINWQTLSGLTQDAVLDMGPANKDLAFTPRTFATGLGEIKRS